MILGVSEGAVRKRVDRGTLRHEKDADGRIYVYLDGVEDGGGDASTTRESNALTSALEERIASLEHQLEAEREANRENRRLLAAALERIPPQLEAAAPPESPSEPPGGPPNAGTGLSREEPRPGGEEAQEPSDRPWWRRMFGG